jgi:hypothetical protein
MRAIGPSGLRTGGFDRAEIGAPLPVAAGSGLGASSFLHAATPQRKSAVSPTGMKDREFIE